MMIPSSWRRLAAVAALSVAVPFVLADEPKELWMQFKYPIDFEFPDEATREQALADGSYNPINTIPTGIKVSQPFGWLFVCH